jgi:cold-inducible RNA-binding protein
MGSKLYVGNLSYNTTGAELQTLFGAPFVQMGSDSEAQAAISALNGQQQDGRALTVNEAKPKESRSGGGSFGGSRGGSGGGRGGSGGGNRY